MVFEMCILYIHKIYPEMIECCGISHKDTHIYSTIEAFTNAEEVHERY
jgi:hypothetical protein